MLRLSFTKKYVNCSTIVFLNINGIILPYCEPVDYFFIQLVIAFNGLEG